MLRVANRCTSTATVPHTTTGQIPRPRTASLHPPHAGPVQHYLCEMKLRPKRPDNPTCEWTLRRPRRNPTTCWLVPGTPLPESCFATRSAVVIHGRRAMPTTTFCRIPLTGAPPSIPSTPPTTKQDSPFTATTRNCGLSLLLAPLCIQLAGRSGAHVTPIASSCSSSGVGQTLEAHPFRHWDARPPTPHHTQP